MCTTDIGVPAGSLMQGRVVLDASVLKQLRHSRQLSQEELANECSLRHFRVSISSIKRAETGKPVLFRIARELARFYDVPAERLICKSSSVVCGSEDSVDSARDALMHAHHPERANGFNAAHVHLNAVQVQYEERIYVDALSLADKALDLDGPITVRYELNRLKGLLLKLLGLPEKSIPYLLETVELARDDGERCDAWCELADAYLGVNRRAEAEKAMWQAERYAASSGNARERSAHISLLRRSLGGEDGVAAI